MASTIKEVKQSLGEALDYARSISNTGSRDELHAASEQVVALQQKLSDTIAAGAKPCPHCGTMPHGMEQPNSRGGTEYEIGCIPCGDFQHTDGTVREHRVRGGMIPSHAVEAWNNGPDNWNLARIAAPVAAGSSDPNDAPDLRGSVKPSKKP